MRWFRIEAREIISGLGAAFTQSAAGLDITISATPIHKQVLLFYRPVRGKLTFTYFEVALFQEKNISQFFISFIDSRLHFFPSLSFPEKNPSREA